MYGNISYTDYGIVRLYRLPNSNSLNGAEHPTVLHFSPVTFGKHGV